MKLIFATISLFFSVFLSAQIDNSLIKIDGLACESIRTLTELPDSDIIIAGTIEASSDVVFHSSDGNDKLFKAWRPPLDPANSTTFLARYTRKGELKWQTWMKAAGGIDAWASTNDKLGNIIITGNFKSPAVFYGINGDSIVLKGITKDMKYAPFNDLMNLFIVKYSLQGNVIWARSGVSPDDLVGQEVICDNKNNIYLRAHSAGNWVSFGSLAVFATREQHPFTSFNNLLVSYSSGGNEKWILYGSNDGRFLQLGLDKSNDLSLYLSLAGSISIKSTSGEFRQIKTEPEDFKLYKLTISAEGKIIDQKQMLGEWKHLSFHKIRETNDATYVIVEPRADYATGKRFCFYRKREIRTGDASEFILLRLNRNDKTQWLKEFGGSDRYTHPIDLQVNDSLLFISGWFWKDLKLENEGDSIHLKTYLDGQFVACLSHDGKIKWAENCGEHHYDSYDKFLHLVPGKGEEVLVAGGYNMPSVIGNQIIPLTSVPKPNNDKLIYGCTDAFITILHPVSSPLPVLAAAIPAEQQKNPVISRPSQAEEAGNKPVVREPVAQANPDSPSDLNAEPSPTLPFLVFPNPSSSAQGQVNVSVDLPDRSKLEWELFSSSGQLVQKGTHAAPGGNSIMEIPVSDLAAGIYFLKLGFPGKEYTVRLIVGA